MGYIVFPSLAAVLISGYIFQDSGGIPLPLTGFAWDSWHFFVKVGPFRSFAPCRFGRSLPSFLLSLPPFDPTEENTGTQPTYLPCWCFYKYTRTRTHTHTYIYVYVYACTYFVCTRVTRPSALPSFRPFPSPVIHLL